MYVRTATFGTLKRNLATGLMYVEGRSDVVNFFAMISLVCPCTHTCRVYEHCVVNQLIQNLFV